MKARFIVFPMVAVIVMTFMPGCATTETEPTSGIVGFRRDYPLGSVAPDIPFVSMDGKQKTFRQIRQPISIVAFAETPGVACCRLIPELVTLADRFKNDAITVAQISLPTDKCTHGPKCAETCNINDAHLISLCDKDRIAWKAYHRPEGNTVFLIDDRGRIVDISPIGNLQSVAEKAGNLETRYRQQHESMYGGG